MAAPAHYCLCQPGAEPQSVASDDAPGPTAAFTTCAPPEGNRVCPIGRGGVKMHTLYDVTTDIPSFVIITDASVHDSKVMDQIPYESDSFYIFDRAYMATEHLFQIEMSDAYFVVREKSKILYKVLEDKHCSNPDTGVMADQIIVFTGSKTKK